MKQMTLWMMAAILTIGGTVSGFAQDVKGKEGQWTFVGQLTNPGDTLWAFATDNLKERNVVVRNGGTFQFTTELAEAKDYYFLTPSLIRGEGGYGFIVTAVPGEVLQASGFCDKDSNLHQLYRDGGAHLLYEHRDHQHPRQRALRRERVGHLPDAAAI